MFRGPAHGYAANLAVGHTGRFPRSRSEWIVIRSRLRFAAGVSVLAGGLLMGGGAVAVAEPGLGGSAPNTDDGTSNPVQGGPSAGSPVDKVTDTVRETIRGGTGTLGSGARPGEQPSTGATSTVGSGRQPGQQPSTGTSPKTEAGGTDIDQKEAAGLVTADPNPVAAVPNVAAPVTNAAVAPVTDVGVGPVTDVVAPVINVPAPVSDVIAQGQDMVAGAVVPLTQLPSDLSSFMLGIAGAAPVGDGSGGIDGAGTVGGVPIAAWRATCRYLGPAGGRQRNQGGNARCDYARSSVSAVRDGTAIVQWCQSVGCGLVFPACLRQTPANRFLVGAGRCCSARRRGACDPCPCRGAHRIRQANAGFASGTSGIARFAHPAGR